MCYAAQASFLTAGRRIRQPSGPLKHVCRAQIPKDNLLALDDKGYADPNRQPQLAAKRPGHGYPAPTVDNT